MQSMYVQNCIYIRHNTVEILNLNMVAYFIELAHWKQRNAWNIIIEIAMGAETNKFMGSIFIWVIDRNCHWSASENENQNKENVVLTLKEQSKRQQQQQQKKRNKTHTTYAETKFILLFMEKNGLIQNWVFKWKNAFLPCIFEYIGFVSYDVINQGRWWAFYSGGSCDKRPMWMGKQWIKEVWSGAMIVQ